MSNWYKNIWRSFKVNSLRDISEEIYFSKVVVLNKLPDENSIKEKEFIKIIHKGKAYWALFRCPCGCSKLITLPLQKTNGYYWQLRTSKYNRPSLYPSVWQNKGCFSHFVVNNGRIIWCENSGRDPNWTYEKKNI